MVRLTLKPDYADKRKKMRYLIILIAISATLIASDTVKIASLEWQDNSQAKSTKLNWQDAKTYCQELSLTDYNDWRLPTIQELQSIVDISRYDPAIKRGFSSVASSYYWSSSEDVSGAKRAWVVDFKYGYKNFRTKTNENFVRCVRARQ